MHHLPKEQRSKQSLYKRTVISWHASQSAPVRGQMFTGVIVTNKFGQIFTGELELRNEDIIIIGGEPFLRGNNFPKYCFWFNN